MCKGILHEKTKFTDIKIMVILKQAENGAPVPELYQKHRMSTGFL